MSRTSKLPAATTVLIYLTVIYIIGAIGLLSEGTKDLFIFLTPINILLAFAIGLIYHKEWNTKFTISLIIIYLGGYGLELVGTKTGLIFGEYIYKQGLGLALNDVPIVMGINWVLLVYGATLISNRLSSNKLLISSIGASLMVLYDLFLEPSAIKYQFWEWKNDAIPLQNYIAWWVSAFVFIYFLKLAGRVNQRNIVAEGIFWLQLAFFATLLIFNNLI